MSPLRLVSICLVALFALASIAQQPDAVRASTAVDAKVLSQIEAARTGLDQRLTELSDLRQAISDLEGRMHRLERRATVHVLGGEFAQTLVEYLRQLPTDQHFAAARKRRAELMVLASDEELRAERAIHALDPGGIHSKVPGTPVQSSPDSIATAALAQEREALQGLGALLTQSLDALHEADVAGLELERQTVAARVALAGYLFWIPAPPADKTVAWLMPSLAWTVSPTNWRAALVPVGEELAHRPLWPALSLLTVTALLAMRRRLRRALVSLSPAAITWERYRFAYGAMAVVITLALALPVPLLLWTGATLLSMATEVQDFGLALAGALRGVAAVLLGLSAVAWLIEPDGLAVCYFGKDEASLSATAVALRRYKTPFVALLFIAVLNMVDYAPYANRESLGRLAFGLALLASALFLARQLRHASPLMQGLITSAPRSWAVRLHPLWYVAVVAVPLVGFAFSAAGYSAAAAYFWKRTVDSMFLALGAVVLYGMVAMWVRLRYWHLARSSNDKAALSMDARATLAAPNPSPDLAAAVEQARSLLVLLVTLALLAGLWGVWREAMPALEWVGNLALWRSTVAVAGGQLVHTLTVGHLLRAILVGIFTGVVVTRVGALLDIVLLQKLELQTDASYAIKTITRYSFAAAGILIACSILGIGWGDVQWLIAALGVGLGFGLQEIVANFVSGLIVLAERPIRIGDVVTVDKISGKVARIRARATVVIDFDNKEVIIPNKAFITGPVVNWTLSSHVSRLVLKFSVGYGNDPALVQQAILGAVRGVPEVLSDPQPSVFLNALGNSSCDFEVRVYVASVDSQPARHEINLAVDRVLRERGVEIRSGSSSRE